MNNLVYELEGKIYINLTNKCTNSCIFCIRTLKDDVVGTNLWLKNENITLNDVTSQLEKFNNISNNEIIFCGYGEPLLKPDLLLKIAKYIKNHYKNTKIRINTNGQANLYLKKNIVPEFNGLIDAISISLNAQNEELYKEISKPSFKNAYDEMKKFTLNCSNAGIETTMSIVTGYKNYKIDVKSCEKIANLLGAKLKVRKWLEKGY